MSKLSKRPAAELAGELEHAAELAELRISASTRAAYAADWRAFTTWASSRRVRTALPITVQTCAAWLAAMEAEGRAVATIQRRATGLAWAHRDHGFVSPTEHQRIRDVLAGIARKNKGRTRARKRALSASMVRASLAQLDTRDRAIVLVAYCTAARRSELAVATWGDLEPVADGLLLRIRSSKTDQTGQGHTLAILRTNNPNACPVRALRRLREARALDGDLADDSPIFGCSARTITRVIKLAAELAGEDPAHFGAHSARAGFVTTAAEAGIPEHQISEHTGHTSAALQGYIRPVRARRNPATRAVADSLSED